MEDRKIIRNILNKISEAETILLTSHINSDADGLGSCIAAFRWLKSINKRAHVVCLNGVSNDLTFLPDTSEVGSLQQDLWKHYDIVITFDCGDFKRLDTLADTPAVKDAFIINIDHHISNTNFGDINWINVSYASTTLMVFDLLKESGFHIDKDTAIAIYVGLVADTGHFSFSNTDRKCHEAAIELLDAGVKPADISEVMYRNKSPGHLKLIAETILNYKHNSKQDVFWIVFDKNLFDKVGYTPSDTQEFINLLRSIYGCKAAVLFREIASNKFKVSIRTSPEIDAVEIASHWGGGGHARAAGFSIEGKKTQVVKEVLSLVESTVEKSNDAK